MLTTIESVNEGLLLLKSQNITQLCILHFIKTYQKQAYILSIQINRGRERRERQRQRHLNFSLIKFDKIYRILKFCPSAIG